VAADQLCTPSDLASWLQQDLDLSTATLLVECATGVVQGATGQRLVRLTDVANIPGVWSQWLDLPQWPVVSVASVTLAGVTITDWSLIGVRLWRAGGWQKSITPAMVGVNYTHGYASTDQYLQLARGTVLSLCAPFYSNPDGAGSVKIDDYAATYAAMQSSMAANQPLKDALRAQYGGAVGATPMRSS
jgi:hypothetical protein